MSTSENTKIAFMWTPEGRHNRGRPKETWRRTLEKERGGYWFGFKYGWKLLLVLRTKKLGEREHKVLFPSKGRAHHDDDDDDDDDIWVVLGLTATI